MFGGGGKNRNYSSWIESLFGNSGEGCTMLPICLVSLIYMVKIENFTLCMFTTVLKQYFRKQARKFKM